MNGVDLESLLAGGETLTVEFKSDRGPLPDSELVETVICLANRNGGILLIGVENDGTVTGLHPQHSTSRPERLAALIASRTVPPQMVTVTFERVPDRSDVPIAVVNVPGSSQPVATSDGRLLIRHLDTHGQPACRPLYPNELLSWRAERGQSDYSSQAIEDTSLDDFDPVEFARLR